MVCWSVKSEAWVEVNMFRVIVYLSDQSIYSGPIQGNAGTTTVACHFRLSGPMGDLSAFVQVCDRSWVELPLGTAVAVDFSSLKHESVNSANFDGQAVVALNPVRN